MLSPDSPQLPPALFREAMHSAGLGMAIIDLDGRWVEVNPAVERMFGYSAEQMRGRAAVEFNHPGDIESVRAAFSAQPADVIDARHRFLHSNGTTVWVQAHVGIVRDADGQPGYLVVQLRDVSNQHDAEQAQETLHAALLERIAEGERALQLLLRQQEVFAHGISHDLRAPLRAIDSFASLLESRAGAALDTSGRDYLARIRGSTARMSQLIDALLELSRAGRVPLKSEPVDLSMLAEWVGAELQDAEQGRAARIEVEPGLTVVGDERQLKLMLTQLLHNAWKFSRDRDEVRIQVLGERHGDRLRVSVVDQGAGFDTGYAGKLFEPFQRLHGPEHGGGNGMGLAIAQRIVERHGGRIWAESELDRGSRFHVELPVAPASPMPAEPA